MSPSTSTRRPVLVTGASGFIGRHLLTALLDQERPVIALARTPWMLRDMRHPLLRVAEGTLEQPGSYAPLLQEGMSVFHLAAVRRIPGTPARTLSRINAEATAELGARALREGVARFINVSTAMVYGPGREGERTESSGLCTRSAPNHYVRTRAEGQAALNRLARRGLPVVTPCPTIVFGPDHPTHPNRLTRAMRLLVRTRLDLVVGSAPRPRNLVYVSDVVRGILSAEERGEVGQAYILGGQELSHGQFNRVVLEEAGVPGLPRVVLPAGLALAAARLADRARGYAEGAGHAATVEVMTEPWRFSSDRARRRLGYASMSVKEGIRRTLDFIGGTRR